MKRSFALLALVLSGCAAFDPGCADYYNSVRPTVSFGVTLEIPLARSKDLKERARDVDQEEEPFYEETDE
ncbi:MAG: hypothetical protein HC923_01125 [Myxococcales bacterium]|nr:hypothetical protein [Myxococcales bacterium]